MFLSNRFGPDQVRRFVGPDLRSICLHFYKLSAEDKIATGR